MPRVLRSKEIDRQTNPNSLSLKYLKYLKYKIDLKDLKKDFQTHSPICTILWQ